MMLEPKDIEVSAMAMALAVEVESRDDDADWIGEAWSKDHIVEQLRTLPAIAAYANDKRTATLTFGETDHHTEIVDITVGVTAHVGSNGAVACLEFDLTCHQAARWLSQATGETPSALEGAAAELPPKRVRT
eukprot:TRINITY_DN30792_c0_g1_i1.p1 TRINITY_DN30792_c0_g1~~TRINITY_DN30792_c0_g1_i1.p1  ORF type:complete len:132 (+),score=29.57 TRINITY_DN30792_c0_g1_i1:78-473(+)